MTKDIRQTRAAVPRILVISHEASRSGAPLVLLNMLKWIKTHTQIKFDILLIEGGELECEFENLGEVFRPNYDTAFLLYKVFKKFLKKLNVYEEKSPLERLLYKLQKKNYTVIYGNTIVSISVFEKLYQYLPKSKYILHVHELYSITKLYSDTLEKLKTKPIIFISVSKLVTENLKENHNIESEIKLIYSFVEINSIQKDQYFKKIGQDSKFIIDGAGFVQPRKGYDIFILVAKRAVQKYPDIPFEFRWIGNIPKNLIFFIDNDICLAGLSENLKFLGEIKKPFQQFAQSDIFLLTSRQDPFPLVCLEHAALGIPVLCFENATGITEFVQNDAGVVIPYLDIEKTVDSIAMLYNNPAKREKMGFIAKDRASQFDINIQVPKILDIISNAQSINYSS